MNLESWTSQTIPDCFEKIAALSPERMAVVSGEMQLSRGALAAAAAKLARALASHGVSPGERVVLLLPDDIPMVIGWLGTLKSGAVCVPISSSHPEERLRAIIADAAPVVLVTDDGLLDLATRVSGDGGVPVLNLDELPATDPGAELEPALTPESHAYILYTSGTTGRPKGVIQTHRNVLKNARVLAQLMEIRPGDRMAGLTAFSMGQGVATLFVSLLNGATLYPYAIRRAGLAPLAQWLDDRQISVYTSSVTVFRQFAGSVPVGTVFPHLRVIRLGAEELRIADVKLFQQRFPRGCMLLNCLGSTETMNYARYVIDHDTVITSDAVPVGHPPEGTTLSLLRSDGSECAGNETGEIVVRTRYLSPGYWRDAGLTAQRFQGTGTGRFYRTGDLGRRLPDGSIEFLGRRDHLVKIRGNRIELGDVENTLLNHSEITQAAVLVHQDAGVELVACVVTRLDEAAVRAFLRDNLPEYMMPSVIVRMDSLPLTPGGKIDREALRAQSLHDRGAGELTRVLPRNEWETGIARCWAHILGCDIPGVHDDFMALGGDSLKTLRLFAEIQSSLNITFDARDVFESFTVASMAGIAGTRSQGKKASSGAVQDPACNFLVTIRPGGDQDPMIVIPGGWGGDNEILLLAGVLGALKTERAIYAVRSRALDPSWPGAGTLKEHAAAVFQEVQQVVARGRWLLIGECVAASVAMELASQAETRSLAPEAVVLLDPYMPPRRPFLSRLLGRPNKVQESAGAANHPEPIREYFRLVKRTPSARIRADLHVIQASDAKEPLHAPQYWGRLTRGRLHLHTVRGTHESYVRGDAAATAALLNAILFHGPQMQRENCPPRDVGNAVGKKMNLRA